MTHRIRGVVVGVCVLAASSASAQRTVASVELSGVNVWYADTIRSAGASLSPSIRVDWANATLSASSTFSKLGGGSSVQGVVAPSVFAPSVGPITGELAAAIGGSSHHDGTRTGQAIGIARAHLLRTTSGGWIGGGIGRSWDGAVSRGVRQAEAGAWMQRDGVDVLGSVTPVVVEDSLRYTDVEAALRVPARVVELGVTGGFRSGSVGVAVGGTSRAWGSVTATAWVDSRAAIVASAGSYPVDLTQGYPGGRFVTVALRIGGRPSRLATTNAERDSPIAQFETRRAAAGRWTFRVNAAHARTVDLSGDFTSWSNVRLTPEANGWWTVTLPVARGTHQVNVRLDGGPWLAPPGLLTSRDEFGGVVGILTIE